jgi:outer membrane lipoprotein-sorting protein
VLPTVLPSPAQLLVRVAERRATVTSIRGFAQIAYENGEDNVGARHAVLATRPDHFRLEVLSPFGALAVVACDGRELVVYARRENVMYRGPASAESVGTYTAVPVAVADVVAILLGTPPERTASGPATVARDETAGRIRLSVPLASGRQEIWFAPDSLLPVASETPLPDGRTLRVDFDDYRALAQTMFPYHIAMRAEPGSRAVRVDYTSPTLNSAVDTALFELPPRSGIKELVIDAYPPGGES